MKQPLEKFTLGTKVYLIHKNWVGKKHIGASIILAKVKTFRRFQNGIAPVFTAIGNTKHELTLENYMAFLDINKAIVHL